MCDSPHPKQLNETMNNLVAAFSVKIKSFSGTLLLKTHVGIAAGVLALRYLDFWTHIFDELGLEMDPVFQSALTARGKNKSKK